MGDKKHIDRLFQEHFKDFEITPDADVWNRIQDELGHKKKRRVIPFWMQLGGIAAALALLFMLGYNLFSGEDKQTTEEQIVNEDVKKDTSPILIENEDNNSNEAINNEINLNDAIVDQNKNNETTAEEKEVIANQSAETNNKTQTNKKLTNDTLNTDAVVAKDNNSSATKTNLTDKKVQLTKNQGAVANNNTSGVRTKKLTKDPYKKDATTLIDKTEKNAVANTDKKEENNNLNPAVSIEKNGELKNNTAITDVGEKAQEDVVKKEEKDELPSILDAIAKEEKNTDIAKVESPSDKKWSVNPMVAPVYYNTVGEGSPIHSQFKDNAKSGNINLSYGVGVAYQLSKRLSVRSGVNVVNLGYETEEIAFTASLDGGNLETISYNSNTSRLNVKDRTPGDFGNFSSDAPNDVTTNRGPAETIGVMSQQFGYVEVPVELKYRLVDKKIGINLIGGLSSLFLTDNNISLESIDNLITDVGEANNINNTSFTTNVGLGIDYALSNNLQLNLEPIFKYQLNAFNRDAGDFQPFYMGVYTGISFKF